MLEIVDVIVSVRVSELKYVSFPPIFRDKIFISAKSSMQFYFQNV